jgi:hypothetical protein
MAVNRISLNGRLTTWQEAELDPSQLLGANWVYTTINTFGYKPFALKEKLRYAAESCKVLFGTRPQCGVEEIAEGLDCRTTTAGEQVVISDYCIRREIGECLLERPRLKGDLFLVRGTKKYRLCFDCKKCQMKVIDEK